jgi:hypothetical protein
MLSLCAHSFCSFTSAYVHRRNVVATSASSAKRLPQYLVSQRVRIDIFAHLHVMARVSSYAYLLISPSCCEEPVVITKRGRA